MTRNTTVWSWFGPEEIEVTPGVIDRSADTARLFVDAVLARVES